MTRVISISDDAYDALKKLKADRSFSEIIIEVVREKKKDKFMKCIGSWTEEDADRIKKEIYEERKGVSRRFK